MRLPLPAQPPTFRDFYAFEAHVRNARQRRGLEVPPEWYQFPVFYFSNPFALYRHDQPIPYPPHTQELDYELEIACVLSRAGRDIQAADAHHYIRGLTILNDWSARDIQRQEVRVGLGPAKGKDFATSFGPELVTLDELADCRVGDPSEMRFDLGMTARVNGQELSRGNFRDIHFTFGQMIARASQSATLQADDLIGSGTVGTGCLLEGAVDVLGRWLQPGDIVELEVERLGILRNQIQRQEEASHGEK